MYYAGIDWANDHHDVVVIDKTNQAYGTLQVQHNFSGLPDLDRFFNSISPDQTKLACIIETNQGLLIAHLLVRLSNQS